MRAVPDKETTFHFYPASCIPHPLPLHAQHQSPQPEFVTAVKRVGCSGSKLLVVHKGTIGTIKILNNNLSILYQHLHVTAAHPIL
jgi:hypothetical protein